MADTLKKHSFKILLLLVFIICAVFIVWNLLPTKPDFPMKKEAAAFELTNLDGSSVSLENTQGKVRLVYFYYSHCPDVCPPTTHMLSKVQESLQREKVFGEKAAILSITFDPERDTTERLREFSQFFNPDYSGWYFLRGEEKYTRDVAYEYGISVMDMGDGILAHQNIIFLVDQDGFIRKYYDGSTVDPEEIAEDVLSLI